MQIKNINQFRLEWKDEQGYEMANWDENFIGATHDTKSGFYKMVNGIVNNIKADLTPKLQNAQDEQAIYEFLQNAADCGSTECAVIYDEEFFMVLNNGQPFTNKDVKALLNTFQGTKADKTKAENCGKIGRYGIGFKLAYRLLGKSDGVNELLNDLAGPTIFSWTNKSEIENLKAFSPDDRFTIANDASDNTPAPWLMKVILACFPSMPEEVVKDVNYEERIVFEMREINNLVSFLNKHKHLLENLDLSRGSLFFLKFGPRKHEKLKESLLNLKSGIGYAMNTLKTLEKVVLQDEVIEKYPVDFEKFAIQPGTPDFKKIDPEYPFCPIEIAFGFPTSIEQAKALKKSPSIYQFFPMRNERHNTAFFIHGTSFAKITDRTRLDDQGEANKETFSFLVKALIQNLDNYKKTNPTRFANIYRAFLLSDRPDSYNSELINDYLYEPLLAYMRNNIISNKSNFYPKDLIVLKDTLLPVEPMSFGIGKEWFYWTQPEVESDLISEAANNAKLGLRRWSIKSLIMEGSIHLINSWIEGLGIEDYEIFIKEMIAEDMDEAFLEKLKEVNCFKFVDSNDQTHYYSIEQLASKENVFLINQKTAPIKDAIKALGLAVLEFNIQDYEALLQQLIGQTAYLTDDKALFQKLSEITHDNDLESKHKQDLFTLFTALKGLKKEDLKSVRLFKNQLGKIRPLEELISIELELEPWLDSFRIDPSEDYEALQGYYVHESKETLFYNVIANNWTDLSKDIDSSSASDFYQMVQEYNKLSNRRKSLKEVPFIFINDEVGFVDENATFYHKVLSELDNYDTLASGIHKLTGKYLPFQSALPVFESEPFRLSPVTASRDWRTTLQNLLSKAAETDLLPEEKASVFGILTRVVRPNELTKLVLFSNERGNASLLKNLLPSTTEVDDWLMPFRIKSDEKNDALGPYLSKEEDIYANIIHPNWQRLTEDTSIIEEIGLFYEKVFSYFESGRFNRPLTHANYIFIDEATGFVSAKATFYHPLLKSVKKYDDLKQAVYKLTSLHLPHQEVLPFLEKNPFKTNMGKLTRSLILNQDELPQNALKALLQFMDEAMEDLFSYYYIIESETKKVYTIARREKLVPYFLEKKKATLHQSIAAAFGDRYQPLPQELYFPDHRNRGLVKGSELFKILSRSNDPELMSALLVESGNTDIKEQVFEKLDKITLKLGAIYDQTTLEHQSLQVFKKKDANRQTLIKKIFIEDAENKVWNLADIGFNPEVIFEVERAGKYILQLDEILPELKSVFNMLHELSTQFPDLKSPEWLMKKVFFGPEQKDKRHIFNKLKQGDKILGNAHQLAFLLLMAKTNNNSQWFRDFSIQTLGGNAEMHKSDFLYVNPTPFIEPTAIIDASVYSGLDALLKMDKKPIFRYHNNAILLDPCFDKSTFIATPLKAEEPDDVLFRKTLDFIYMKWMEDQKPGIVLNTGPFKGFLWDINFVDYVYPDDYALEAEQIPDWMREWLEVGQTGDKFAFLQAAGLHGSESSNIAFRKYFLTNEGEVSRKQINDMSNNDPAAIRKMCHWLHESGIELSSNDDRIVWLRSLYSKLDSLKDDIPVPFISKIEEEIFYYTVATVPRDTIFAFDDSKLAILTDTYGIPVNELFEKLSGEDRYLINVDIKGLQAKTTTVEKVLDRETLEAQAQEWGAPYYLEWKENNNFEIYLFDGEIPYKIRFLDVIVKEFSKGNAVLDGERVFVNNFCDNIEKELLSITNRTTGLTEGHLFPLLRMKNDLVEQINPHKVIVKEPIEPEIETFDNPSVQEIEEQAYISQSGKLNIEFDIKDLTPEMLTQLSEMLTAAKSVQMKVKKAPEEDAVN
ncbi:MAG: ATP-binding protein [Bacteroidota bacterium]